MPDADLYRAAQTGSILQPEVLVQQAARMLHHERIRALAIEFAAQWLEIREFDQHEGKNERMFPTFVAAARPCTRNRSVSSKTSFAPTEP